MIVYFGRRYSSTSVGSRVVEVDCEKCGHHYYYQLARVGSGESNAPYNLGAKKAEEKAGQKAQDDLSRRLAEDAEMVPCPQCQWVSEALVVGYRQSRYQELKSTAIGFAVIGVSMSLMIALLLGTSRAPDPTSVWVAWVAGVGGTALSVGFAASLLGLRALLRRRIDPNRNHPFASPRLPVGTPPALRLDPATQYLHPTTSPETTDEHGGVGLHIQIGRSGLPGNCCGCGGQADPQASHQRILINPLTLTVPLCRACASRWTKARWMGGLIGTGAAALVAAPLLYLAFGTVETPGFGWLLGLCSVIGLTTGLGIVGSRATPLRIRLVDRPRGVVRLWFRNRAYILGPSEAAPVNTSRFAFAEADAADPNPYRPPSY